jgi:MFS family permease
MGAIITRLSHLRVSIKSIYYGWIVVGACNGIAFITWGVAIFNQGVFLGYFVSEYGWSPATLSVGPTLFHLCAGLAGVPIGRIVDRHGPRIVLLGGAVLVGAGSISFGWVREPWHTYPVFILLGCGFACIHTITLGKIITHWFVKNRSRAMAASTFGAGLGGALLVPLNAVVIQNWGVLSGGIVLAIITIGVIGPLALWVVKDGPQTHYGVDNNHTELEPEDAHSADLVRDNRSWTLRQAMHKSAFWGLSIFLALGMVAQGGFLLHQMMFLQIPLGLTGAASIVSVTTLMGMVGRIGFVLAGNLLSMRAWLAVMFACQAAGFLLLATGSGFNQLLIGAALFGLTMGNIVVLQPMATASIFGQRDFGRIYGPIYLSIRIGAAIGPLLAGILVVMTGGYQSVWLLMAAGLLVGSVGIFWTMSPSRR